MPYTVLDQTTAQAAPTTNLGKPLTSIGMTKAEMIAEMLVQMQNRTDIDPARMLRYLNLGYLNLCQQLDLKEVWGSIGLTTVANQPFYLLPTSTVAGQPPLVAWIKRLAIEDSDDFTFTGGRELDLIDEETYRTMPDTTALVESDPTLPVAYFRWLNMLVIWPTPSDAFSLTLDFRIRPVNLINDTDCPILPYEFHEAVFFAGLERAWRSVRNTVAANQAANDKLMILRPLMNADAEERSAMHMTLSPARSRADLFFSQSRVTRGIRFNDRD